MQAKQGRTLMLQCTGACQEIFLCWKLKVPWVFPSCVVFWLRHSPSEVSGTLHWGASERRGCVSCITPITAPVQNAAASQSCFTKKKTISGEQMQVLAVYFARRPMFPQQGEPMTVNRLHWEWCRYLMVRGVAVAPDTLLLLLGVSRVKLALKTEMFLKYKVY